MIWINVDALANSGDGRSLSLCGIPVRAARLIARRLRDGHRNRLVLLKICTLSKNRATVTARSRASHQSRNPSRSHTGQRRRSPRRQRRHHRRRQRHEGYRPTSKAAGRLTGPTSLRAAGVSAALSFPKPDQTTRVANLSPVCQIALTLGSMWRRKSPTKTGSRR